MRSGARADERTNQTICAVFSGQLGVFRDFLERFESEYLILAEERENWPLPLGELIKTRYAQFIEARESRRAAQNNKKVFRLKTRRSPIATFSMRCFAIIDRFGRPSGERASKE